MRDWQIAVMNDDAYLAESTARIAQWEDLHRASEDERLLKEATSYIKAAINSLTQANYKLQDAQSILDGTVHAPKVDDLYEELLSIRNGLRQIIDGR